MFKVLTYAQQSKELANIEQDKLAKRIQEFRTQAQLDNLQASNSLDPSVVSDGIHGSGISSYRSVETAPQSIVNGKVKTVFKFSVSSQYRLPNSLNILNYISLGN